MRYVTTLAALALWLLAAPGAALAQSSEEFQALKQAVEALRADQQRLEREVTEIKDFLRARPAAAAAPDDTPKNLVLSMDGGHVKGDERARLALVDFTDYQ
jgi:hypothetical protein